MNDPQKSPNNQPEEARDPYLEHELRARQGFQCPACGGEAVWNPAKQELSCPFCGTVSEAELAQDGSLIVEHDLMEGLARTDPSVRTWEKDKKMVRCTNCNAVTVFEQTRVAQRCDFCASPAVVPYDQMKQALRPESLLPFQIDQGKVRESMRHWYSSRFWAPRKLKRWAMTDQLHGVYVPYWTFDARVVAQWSAMAGHYYYTRDSNGQTKREVRWTPASGSLQHFFDDQLVAASKGLDASLLNKIEPFPTAGEQSKLKPYDSGYVSGWVVEQYQLDLAGAARSARKRMENLIYQMCAAQVPGDTYRNLQVQSQFSKQTYKHILLPVWLLSYNYGARTYQCMINGYTGKIAGKYPISWLKVTLAVILGLIVLGLFVYFNQS